MDRAIAITLDIEWACQEVLDDVLDLFEQYRVPLTLFCTHPIDTRGHEPALHPNFLRTGADFQQIAAQGTRERVFSEPVGIEREVLARLKLSFPEAIGVRTHSLVTSTWIGLVLADAGIQYDSSCYSPLQSVQPFRRERGLWEFPIFYMDYMDLLDPSSRFDLNNLPLDCPGLKVFDFHPTLIYINASRLSHCEEVRPCYHDPEALRRHENPDTGVRTLLLDLLEYATRRCVPLVTLGQCLEACRQGSFL